MDVTCSGSASMHDAGEHASDAVARELRDDVVPVGREEQPRVEPAESVLHGPREEIRRVLRANTTIRAHLQRRREGNGSATSASALRYRSSSCGDGACSMRRTNSAYSSSVACLATTPIDAVSSAASSSPCRTTRRARSIGRGIIGKPAEQRRTTSPAVVAIDRRRAPARPVTRRPGARWSRCAVETAVDRPPRRRATTCRARRPRAARPIGRRRRGSRRGGRRTDAASRRPATVNAHASSMRL